MTYFTYNGRSSADFGLHIEKKDVFSAPEYDAEFISIPGRSGDIINPNRRFSNIKVTYTVFLARKNAAALADVLRTIKGWLYSEPDRYHKLTDSYDAEYFRYGVISGNLDIEEQLNKVGSFTVTFNCKPYKYSFAGQETVSADASELTITNPTAFESRPYIKLYGSGAVVIMIQPQGRGIMISNLDEYIEIDSELMNCSKGTALKNDTVKGTEFPVFKPGVCTINCTGNVTRIVLDVGGPSDQLVDATEDFLDLFICQQRRLPELELGKLHVGIGSFTAVSFGLAELAPFAAVVFAVSVEGKLCSRGQNLIGPLVEFVLRNGEGADVGASGLVDGHADGVDVVDAVEQLQRTEGVQLHGQQRLTSLYAVMKGKKVINSKYDEKAIVISYCPLKNKFEVGYQATKKDPEWIYNISEVFTTANITKLIINFTKKLAEYRTSKGEALSDEEQDLISENITALSNLKQHTLPVFDIKANAEEEDVSEIFVRVNSGGVALKQNDFILTLLSLYWDEGRKEIEQFSMESTYPSKDKITSYNQLTEVTAQDVIRVVMAYAFDRARLKYGYKLLRGADFDKKGAVDVTLRDQRFDVLKAKLPDVLNVHNWHEFLKSIMNAGYLSGDLILSGNAIYYTYAFYLIAKYRFNASYNENLHLTSLWFFYASLVSLYTGSFEFSTILESSIP